MSSVTYSTPSFLSVFHGLIHSHFAGEWYDLHCFVTGQGTNADAVLEKMADCLSRT